MMKKAEFDNIIKENLIKRIGKASFGYCIGEKVYENYYSADAFKSFIKDMKKKYKDAFAAYDDGAGGELEKKRGRYGLMPPKMASVASSSRFCYLALRDGAKVFDSNSEASFEHECAIDGIASGTAPQLDAYIPDREIYIEAKCHEIFDSHKVIMKEKYWECIYGEGNPFGMEPKERESADKFEIPLSVFGIDDKKGTMFDIKQFLCHLLGIASRKDKLKEATLVYLFFKPKSVKRELTQEIDEVFDELRGEIKRLFESAPIKKFTSENNIELMAVAEYSEVMEALTKDNIIDLLTE